MDNSSLILKIIECFTESKLIPSNSSSSSDSYESSLREAESRWITKRFTKKETGKQWKEQSNELFVMRNYLFHEFRFAYRNEIYLLGRINAIAKSQSYAAMIQDLNDLSVLGKNKDLLVQIHPGVSTTECGEEDNEQEFSLS